MVFVLVMAWYGHVPKNTLSAIGLSNQAPCSSDRSKRAVGDEAYFHTESGFSFAAGVPFATCSSRMVTTSASVTLEYQVLSG